MDILEKKDFVTFLHYCSKKNLASPQSALEEIKFWSFNDFEVEAIEISVYT